MFDSDLPAVNHHFGATVAYIHEGEELVDREEVLSPVAERPGHIAGIIRKRFGGVARLPPALVLKRLRQVPVIESRKGFDAGFEKRIDEAAVEVEALCIRLTEAAGKDSWPGDGETVRLNPQILHEPQIILVAMIVIDRDIRVVAVPDLARRVRVAVPDRCAATVFLYSALDLKRGRGDTPGETLRKRGCGALHRFRLTFCRGL